MPLRELFRTIYKSYNELFRIGGWVCWGMFRVWREQNEEMDKQLKMICRKLKKEPRGIIEGVGDIVYV